MKVKARVEKEIDVKTVQVHVKVVDRGSYTLLDGEGKILKEANEQYVPSFFPEEHYGDYLILDIDIDTGKINNWKVPSAAELQEYIEGDR